MAITIKSRKKAFCSGIAVSLIVISAIVIIIVFAKPKTRSSNYKQCIINGIPSTNKLNILSSDDLITNWTKSDAWNVCQLMYGPELTTIYNNSIRALYPQNSANPSGDIYGGFHFYAQPSVFPSQTIRMNYSVKFDSNFIWVKGGKLPGIWIGDTGANGGNHIMTGSSFRLMWRQSGLVEAYVYAPKQLPEYYNFTITNLDGEYGDSVKRGIITAIPNEWISVSLYAKLNTFTNNIANYDGVLQMIINNNIFEYDKMKWIDVDGLLINGMMMQTFFGGNGWNWQTPVDQYIFFNNFSVEH